MFTSFIFMAENDGVRARLPGLQVSTSDTTIPGWRPSALGERLGGPWTSGMVFMGFVI